MAMLQITACTAPLASADKCLSSALADKTHEACRDHQGQRDKYLRPSLGHVLK